VKTTNETALDGTYQVTLTSRAPQDAASAPRP